MSPWYKRAGEARGSKPVAQVEEGPARVGRASLEPATVAF